MAQELHFIIRTYENWTDEAIQEIADEFVRLYDGNFAIESAYLREVRELVPQEWDCDHCGKHIETAGTTGPEHDENCENWAPVNHCDDNCDAPTDHGGPCPGYEPPEAFVDGYSVGYHGTEPFIPEGEWELAQYERGKAAGEARFRDEVAERGFTICDRCNDVSNSAPNLVCGRLDEDDEGNSIGTPCTGTYRTPAEWKR